MSKKHNTTKNAAENTQAATTAVAATKTESKKIEKVPVIVAPVKTADMTALRAVCESIVSREKGAVLSESQMMVASAALCGDRWGEFVSKEQMLKDVNERTSFGGYYYRTDAADRKGKFNLYRGVHRDVSAHYGCKLGRATNVLEAETMETAYNEHNKKASKRSVRCRVSPIAAKVLAEYAGAIAAKFSAQ